jgi:flagellin-like protein
MKGVSAIIATILMLIITIGLAGTAYIYISGVMTGRTAKTISLLDASCSGGDITVVLSNDGTTDITATDLGIWVDGADASGDCNEDQAVVAHTTAVILCSPSTAYGSGGHEVLVTSPTNSGRITAYC